MKALLVKHKRILLCLLIVLLLGVTVYTVCCFNGWGVQMSEMPVPYLWIYLRTNGYPNISYEAANDMRYGIEKLEDNLYYGLAMSSQDPENGWMKLGKIVAAYYDWEYIIP